MMINHDFVSSFFPRVSQHVPALSSDWFIGLRPSVYDTDPLYLKEYNHFQNRADPDTSSLTLKTIHPNLKSTHIYDIIVIIFG